MRNFILSAAALLSIGSTARGIDVSEPVDFGNTYDSATFLPFGSAVVGAVPQGDIDYFAFQLPRTPTNSDQLSLTAEVSRVATSDRHRVTVYVGNSNIVGSEDFFSSDTKVIGGYFIGGNPAVVTIRVGGLFVASPVDANYRIQLSTTVPEPNASLLALSAILSAVALRRRLC